MSKIIKNNEINEKDQYNLGFSGCSHKKIAQKFAIKIITRKNTRPFIETSGNNFPYPITNIIVIRTKKTN